MCTAVTVATKAEQITTVFDGDAYENLPRFEASELVTGRVLGRGGFCVVHELNSLNLIGGLNSSYHGNTPSHNGTDRLSDSDSDGTEEVMTRETVARRVRQSNKKRGKSKNYYGRSGGSIMSTKPQGGRYCVKFVAEELAQQRQHKMTYLKGTVDLLIEAKFLSSLAHDNIIKIRGMSTISPIGKNKGKKMFLIVDRLHETFSCRLKKWMQKARRTKGVTGMFLGNQKRKQEKLLNVRIQAAYDIADVMNYLHSNNIIYRDLKPDNIGFDGRGNLKIFDFGLAKELRLENMDRDTGCYHLTSFTGAIRYMAPEVGLRKPYNLKADVYSWSILLWYILALEPPYGYFTPDMFVDRVFKRGIRPAIREEWSLNLTSLMKKCWQDEINCRPSFNQIKEIVRYDLIQGDGKYINDSNSSSGNTARSSQNADDNDNDNTLEV